MVVTKLYGISHPLVCVIIQGRTGTVYTNQTNGTLCWQQEMEGVAFPFVLHPENDLWGHLGKIEGIGSLSSELANDIDQSLRVEAIRKYWWFQMRVDRRRAVSSHEAWLYVQVWGFDNVISGISSESGELPAVLTWENSD